MQSILLPQSISHEKYPTATSTQAPPDSDQFLGGFDVSI